MKNEDRSAEAARRWRLVLGQDAIGAVPLNVEDAAIDGALDALYGTPESAKGGLGASAPRVARWLGDIREYFPSSVVQVMQKDGVTDGGTSAARLSLLSGVRLKKWS